jgi:hypothetical protein
MAGLVPLDRAEQNLEVIELAKILSDDGGSLVSLDHRVVFTPGCILELREKVGATRSASSEKARFARAG